MSSRSWSMREGIFFLEGIFSFLLLLVLGSIENWAYSYLFICGSSTNSKILSPKKNLISAAKSFKITLNEVQLDLNLTSNQAMNIPHNTGRRFWKILTLHDPVLLKHYFLWIGCCFALLDVFPDWFIVRLIQDNYSKIHKAASLSLTVFLI